ncbi:hypothetical protein ACQ4PT_044697 [Festuca glaucescens]
MENFEFDPTPWVPAGFQIEDGGLNRLPRTFVTPSAPMVDAHEGWAVAMVELPPPEHLLHEVMEQVRNFLLDRDLEIVNSLPWFYGVGAFQFRNPVVRASLVDHGAWQFANGQLRFIKHNEGVGFRTQHGARTGWLMFIGTPMDFRNTETIAEVVNTFGEFHYWQHRDIQKCRILVYATFPSPSQVPRDVVFRQPKVARYTGLRHSWTAPVYILSAEMADMHPADEDPMPLDGNPHPLPGNLQPNNVNFVLPEYPEHIENSDVVSAISSASVAPPVPVLMAANEVMEEGNLALQPVVPDEVLQHIGVAPAAVGEQLLLVQPGDVAVEAVVPMLPDAEGDAGQFDEVAMDILLQEAEAEEVGQEVQGGNVEQVDDEEPIDEEIIIEEGGQNVAAVAEVAQGQGVEVHVSQSADINAADFVFQSQVLHDQSLCTGAIVPYKGKRTWDQAFSNQTGSDADASLQSATDVSLGAAQEDKGKQVSIDSGTFSVGMNVDSHSKKRQKRKKVPVVVPGPRRFTRSQLLLDGHRATPLPGLCPRPRKKSKKGSVTESTSQPGGTETASSTPLPVLQQIGAMLEIDPALLTTEKLMAPVDSDAAVKGANDK